MKAIYTMTAVIGLIMGSAVPAVAQQDSKRELLAVLQDIGCKVTSSADGKNSQIYYAEYTANRRTNHLRICLSEDNSQVWISIPLAKVEPTTAAVNADSLFKLLELNQDVGPSHFKISNNTLYLSGTVNNRDVANHHVREFIESLVSDMERTRKHWDRSWVKPNSATGFRGRD